MVVFPGAVNAWSRAPLVWTAPSPIHAFIVSRRLLDRPIATVETTRTFQQDVGADCSNSCVARYLSIISCVAPSSAVPFRERSHVRAGKMRSTRYLVIPGWGFDFIVAERRTRRYSQEIGNYYPDPDPEELKTNLDTHCPFVSVVRTSNRLVTQHSVIM